MRLALPLFAVYGLTILAATTVAPTAAAHPVSYVAGIYVVVDVSFDPTTAEGFILIVDNVFGDPVVGDYCQDNNNDNICGGTGDFGDDFCGAVHLSPGPFPAANWDPTIPTQARVHAVVFLCGTPTFGSTGVFVHS